METEGLTPRVAAVEFDAVMLQCASIMYPDHVSLFGFVDTIAYLGDFDIEATSVRYNDGGCVLGGEQEGR